MDSWLIWNVIVRVSSLLKTLHVKAEDGSNDERSITVKSLSVTGVPAY